MQALYEFGMAQALFSSVLNKATPEIGGLACGNTFSPHQATLDIEAGKEFNELAYGFEVSDSSLGLDEVIRARFEQGFHMSSEHTLASMQDGVPFSAFLPHGLPGGACHDKGHTQTSQLLERAAEAVAAARLRGRDAGPDVELGEALYACVREAAAELKIEAPPLP
jgi:trimethylamine:corrinoid methyltransferase-like protein